MSLLPLTKIRQKERSQMNPRDCELAVHYLVIVRFDEAAAQSGGAFLRMFRE